MISVAATCARIASIRKASFFENCMYRHPPQSLQRLLYTVRAIAQPVRGERPIQARSLRPMPSATAAGLVIDRNAAVEGRHLVAVRCLDGAQPLLLGPARGCRVRDHRGAHALEAEPALKQRVAAQMNEFLDLNQSAAGPIVSLA